MLIDDDPDKVLATITASPGRRILGIGSLWILSLMVIYVGIVRPPELGWQLFLFALGGGSIWIAEQMRRATSVTLELTRQELRDTAGVVLARMDEVTGLDRGMFAFKPSNGFLLRPFQKIGHFFGAKSTPTRRARKPSAAFAKPSCARNFLGTLNRIDMGHHDARGAAIQCP